MKPNQSSPIKKYGTIIIVVLLIALAYFYMSGSSAPAGTLSVSSVYGDVGSAELHLLNQVRSLRIDTALFSDQAFVSLKDYSVPIAPENVGTRPNPFAPLPGEAAKSASQSSPATSR